MAVELAGLVLGGIPVAIWALEKYAEPFEAFHDYRTSIETLSAELTLQNRHLQTTLTNIGLPSDPSPEELCECFKTKFPAISRDLLIIIQQMDKVTLALMEKLQIDVNQKVGASALQRVTFSPC